MTTVHNRASSAHVTKTSHGLTPAQQQAMTQLSSADRQRMQMILASQQDAMSSILSSLNSMKGASVRPSSVMPSSATGFGNSSFDPKTLSDAETRSLQGLSETEQGRLRAQYEVQHEQEQVAFISNMMKKRNEIAMSIINNLK